MGRAGGTTDPGRSKGWRWVVRSSSSCRSGRSDPHRREDVVGDAVEGGTGAYAEDGDGQLIGGTTGVNVAYPDAAVAHDDEAVRSSPSPQVRQPRALPRIRVATGVDDGPTVPVASAGRRAVSGDATGSLTVQCAAARGLPRRGFCAPGLVYFGAEFGEPVFVARRVGRSAGSGCGLVRPRRIAGQRPARRSSRRARPWRRSPARARRRPGRAAR